MRGGRAAAFVVVGLLALHLALVLDFARKHSAVFDEVVYPTSGYSYWKTGDYRLNPEHPPLLKLWTALPWLGLDVRAERVPGWWERDQWRFGQALLFESGPSPQSLLFRARAMTALLSVGLGLCVWGLGARLFGRWGGLAALALYVFDPLVIAHAGLATTDLGAGALYAFTIAAFAREVSRRGWGRFLATGIVLGMALGAKFSMLVLVPVVFVVALLLAPKGERLLKVGTAAIALVVGWGVVVALYWGDWGLYFEGLGRLLYHGQVGHPAYAFGRYSREGWWWYFPAAWVVKTPLPLLLLTAAGAGWALSAVVRAGRARGDKAQALETGAGERALPRAGGPSTDPRWLCVMLLAVACVWFPATVSSLNLGVRHLLPATPFLAVLGAGAAMRIAARPWGAWTVGVLVSWLALGTLAAHPHELSYASALVGGARHGWRYLADSSVDWGQDLPALAEQLERQPLRRLYLGYFGTADPAAYGIERYHWIPSFGMAPRRSLDGPDPQGREWIAISITNLLDVYSGKHEGYAWLRKRPVTAFPGYSIALFDITGDAEAHRRLGETALYYREAEAALVPLCRAVELDPADERAQAALRRALALLGRDAEPSAACRERQEVASRKSRR